MRRSESKPAPARAVRPIGIPLALSLALAIAGCAADQPTYRQGSWLGGAPPPAPRVAMEDDGQPAQTPPLRRSRPEPDDPREPFSPNYGPPPLPGEQVSPTPPALPADLPPAFRRRLASAMKV